MQWPCGPDEKSGRAIRYRDRAGGLKFPTSTGRGCFFARPCLPPAEMPDPEFPLILTTGRVANQWHTMTKTGKVGQLNKLNPGPFVEIHPEDASLLEIREAQGVEVKSRRGKGVYPAKITDRIRPGVCFVPFHWNDLFGENLAINEATVDAVDPISKQPEFKFCAVSLAPIAAPAAPAMNTPISMSSPPGNAPFTPEQKEYFQGFVSGLSVTAGPLSPALALGLPEEAPFTPMQRAWACGLLAGAFSRQSHPDSESHHANTKLAPENHATDTR